MTEKADYQEIINEYKEQVRVLKEQLNELTDAGKSKDSALKRTLQKLEYVTEDLDKANKELVNTDTFVCFADKSRACLKCYHNSGASLPMFRK